MCLEDTLKQRCGHICLEDTLKQMCGHICLEDTCFPIDFRPCPTLAFLEV